MRLDVDGLVRNVHGAAIKATEREVVEHFAETPLYLDAAIACRFMPANVIIDAQLIDQPRSSANADGMRYMMIRRTTVVEIPPPWREDG